MEEKRNLIRLGSAQTWQTPTLENSWVNYGTGYQSARFKKDMWNRVWVEGILKNGTTTDTTTIFTLPAGHRPGNVIRAGCSFDNGGTFGVGILIIATDGTVKIRLVTGNSSLAFSFTFEGVQ